MVKGVHYFVSALDEAETGPEVVYVCVSCDNSLNICREDDRPRRGWIVAQGEREDWKYSKLNGVRRRSV